MIWPASWHAVLREHMAAEAAGSSSETATGTSAPTVLKTHIPKLLSAVEGLVHMPFPSHQDGEVESSCCVRPATTGGEGLFPPRRKGQRTRSSP